MKDKKGGLRNILNRLEEFKIDGFGLVIYAILVIILIMVMYLGILPEDNTSNIFAALFIMVVLGNVFYWLGSHLPIFKSYLGGGAVFALFAPALMAITGLIPKSTINVVDKFVSGAGFVDFFIISLIVGAILGMNRKMLLKASVRFLPVAFLSMAIAFLAVGIVSTVIGKGFNYGALFVAFPVMGGGIGAGAIPLSRIYHQAFGGSTDYLSMLMPAVILGNVFAIIGAGLVSKLFANSKGNGHGKMMPGNYDSIAKEDIKITYQKMGVGLMVATAFYMVALTLNHFIPMINEYAFIILLVIIFKAGGLIPKYYEESAVTFSNSITKNLTHALLAGVGLTKLDLPVLGHSLTWQFVILVLTSVVVITIAAGLIGKLFGLYSVESAITAGLVNNSMGGTGNISVLAASNRMNLIGFAQMGNRLGGAIMLVAAGIYISVFG
ncbi:citrate:sodium symporter [Fructilactobacillus lindneri]|uniref:Citrate-sodium symporter n=2 Tax=Fructilactobacillus lindneri TaxID=53444 RepID=A0A0R2JUC6_9LACO|nr:2-hydroxycarboxylate transporter family protein [Fructilactobacillus lindneri]ANZ58060.1 citrate:sodium symporter [Fructilactobacillus lindneri]ANZ59381.1 citrate:sodium symporter [Fructilactobacillus lindneri]KRN80681.1 citrate-sodium symporter [Fructilactobacillus lindneri DSM 20690 = JCM 11027]POG98835.1 citrate:sodium symporter [Fructilactobacillus lindneri]POH03108.1 citrate:sodium symporter [Fructilactobacillus lindneri]